jgi:hypothetical protein
MSWEKTLNTTPHIHTLSVHFLVGTLHTALVARGALVTTTTTTHTTTMVTLISHHVISNLIKVGGL